MSKPILSFCSLGFREEPIEDVVRKLADVGYDAVEVWHKHVAGKSDAELAELKQIAADAGIQLLVISPYLWLTQNQELLDESMDIAREIVHMAQVLGIPKIRTFTDSGPTGIGSAAATPELRAQAVAALKEITAMDQSIRFVVETHEKTLADTPESMLQLLDEVQAPNLRVLFQAGDPATMLDDCQKLKPHIEHIHLHNTGIDGGPGWVDEGDYDFPALLRQLKQDGYAYSMSVEYCFKGGSTWERAESALAFLKQHLG